MYIHKQTCTFIHAYKHTHIYLDSSDDMDCTKKEVYNLKSQKTPPNNKLLDPFEVDLFKLIKIRFRIDYNSF